MIPGSVGRQTFGDIILRFTCPAILILVLATTSALSQSVSEINDRGTKAYARGDYADAVAHYGAAIARDPNEAALFHNRGLAEMKLANYPAAKADFDTAISMRPNIAAFFNSRGGLLMLTRDYSLAAKDFNEAYRLEPLNPTFLENYRRAEAALAANSKGLASPTTQSAQVPQTRCTIGGIPRDVLARFASRYMPADFQGFPDDAALAAGLAHALARDNQFGGGMAKALDLLRQEKTGLPPC